VEYRGESGRESIEKVKCSGWNGNGSAQRLGNKAKRPEPKKKGKTTKITKLLLLYAIA